MPMCRVYPGAPLGAPQPRYAVTELSCDGVVAMGEYIKQKTFVAMRTASTISHRVHFVPRYQYINTVLPPL